MSNIDKQDRQVSRYDLVSGYMQKWPDGEFVYHSDYQALLDELEAAEKRIAELDAREVELPDYAEVYQDEFAKEVEHQVRVALKSAGISIKGE
ncbi:hypothetical protein UXO57_21015 [Enterobacter hormaechei]